MNNDAVLLVFSVYYECNVFWAVFCFPAGVSARSFHQCFNLCSSVFNLQTATPGVRKPTLQHIHSHKTHNVLDASNLFFLSHRGSPSTLPVWMTAHPDGCKSSVSNPTQTQPSWNLSMVWDLSLLFLIRIHKCISIY